MTTDLEIRRDTRPAVIDGEMVVASGNSRNPHVVPQAVSALVMVIAAAVFLHDLHGGEAAKTVSVLVLAVTFMAHLFFLVRAGIWGQGR